MASNAITHHEPFVLPLPAKPVVIGALAVVMLTAITLALRSQPLSPSFLHIDTVQVYGELHWLDRGQLNEAVKPFLTSNFFSADLNGIKQTVEALPWVASASVRRQWPNQLQITVREHHPVARWKSDTLVNENGELFTPAEIPADIAGALVQLQGPDNTYGYLFDQYRELSPLFSAHELVIAKVYLNERRALGVGLSNGMQINFGRVNAGMDVYNVAVRFLQAYDSSLKDQSEKIGVVDLRYTNGFAVQWKNNHSE